MAEILALSNKGGWKHVSDSKLAIASIFKAHLNDSPWKIYAPRQMIKVRKEKLDIVKFVAIRRGINCSGHDLAKSSLLLGVDTRLSILIYLFILQYE